MVYDIVTGATLAMHPVDAREAVAIGDYALAPLQPDAQERPVPLSPQVPRQPGEAA
jgi:hypothetical protein